MAGALWALGRLYGQGSTAEESEAGLVNPITPLLIGSSASPASASASTESQELMTEVLSELQGCAVKLVADFNATDVANSLWGLARMRQPLSGEFALALVRKYRYHGGSDGGAGVHGCRDGRSWGGGADTGGGGLDSFKGQELANVLWALGLLRGLSRPFDNRNHSGQSNQHHAEAGKPDTRDNRDKDEKKNSGHRTSESVLAGFIIRESAQRIFHTGFLDNSRLLSAQHIANVILAMARIGILGVCLFLCVRALSLTRVCVV